MTEETFLAPEEVEIARKYDLTEKISRHLDRHLIYPLIDSLAPLYGEKIHSQLVFDLLKDTYMTDFLREKYQVLNPGKEFPKELEARGSDIKVVSEKLDKQTKETLNILSNKEVQEQLKQDKEYNTQYLSKEHGIDELKINALYDYAQVQYNLGNYVMASDLLNNFRVLSTDIDKIVSATWGKLACEILTMQWDAALQELSKLGEVVDLHKESRDPIQQCQQRCWIIHWALFPFFNTPDGLEKLCDLFFNPQYLTTIQAVCPWIVRYMVAAVVGLGGKKHSPGSISFRKRLQDLVKVVEQEQYEYSDPLTEFIKALYIDFDFKTAQIKLDQASAVIKSDFFLSISCIGAEEFVERARHMTSVVYCRVHNKIELSTLQELLKINKEEVEKWIAKLILNSRMDAKIDESQGTVVIDHPVMSVYQQVIESTKELSVRSTSALASVKSV